jgi:hypothetical protein
MSRDIFEVKVEALDAGQGYLLRGQIIIDGVRTEIHEHYALEADARTRMGTGFDLFAAQVDSE